MRTVTFVKVLAIVLRAFAKIEIVWVAWSVATGSNGLISLQATLPAIGVHAKAAIVGVLLARWAVRLGEREGAGADAVVDLPGAR